MRTLFELQTDSGQLWPDIKAHLDAKDTEHAEAMDALRAELSGVTPPLQTIDSIKAWQAKAVLSLMGLLTSAETVIDSLAEPQRTIVKSAWDNNADFPRRSPTILSLAAALSLTEEQVNAMFGQAAELSL